MPEPGLRQARCQGQIAGPGSEAPEGACIWPNDTSAGEALQGRGTRAPVQRMLGGVPPRPYASIAETSEGLLEFGARMRVARAMRRRNAALVDFAGLFSRLQAL